MEQKQHIDQLFKERFSNHEVTPPPHVWENIQAQLQEKKKDRVIIPLWWKVGGIAAALALLFTLGTTLFNTTNNGVVEEIPTIEKDIETTPEIKKDIELHSNENASQVAESTSPKMLDDAAIKSNQNTNPTTQNSVTNPVKNKGAKATTTTQTAVASVSKNNNTKNTSTQNTVVANATNKTSVLEKTNNTFKNPNEVKTAKEAVATNKVKKNTETKTTTNPQIKEAIVVPTNKEETSVAKTTEENPTQEKQSIFDAIDEQKEIDAKEAVVKTNTPEDRWEVAPNFAPVYYSSLSEGSSIDPSFADNSQSGDVNISYGIGVSYAVNDRLKIRSGVSSVNLSYSTGGLELGDGPVSAALKNIDYNRASGNVIIAQDQGTFAMQQGDGTFGNITPKSTNGEAFINQSINYYEVPLELSYSLVNKKFGIDVIGGVSTLFLGDNEVSVSAGDFSETLGAANNLSGLSFATNVGLGMHYNLSKKFKFNVEPMFKYQLNPYTDSAVDFQPFYVGVYTGLSFKF